MSLKDKNILITGGAGNIGSLLAQSLIGRCRSVVCSDRREPVKNQGDSRNITFIEQDITQDNVWSSFEGKIDLIFHLAAQTSAYRSNESIAEDWKINVKPVIGFLDSLKNKSWRPAMVFSSTATVVGLVNTWPVASNTREVPTTIYDIHKLTVEKYLKYYHEQMGGVSASLRLANVYGPGGGDPTSQDRGIVNQMIRKALSKEALTIYGQGDYVRDYIYIQDVVNAFVCAGEHVESLNGEAYFVGTGKGHTIGQLAEKISKEASRRTGQNVAIKQQPFPAGALSIEQRSFVADSKDFQQLTGWKPAVNLDQGLSLTAEYFGNQKVC